MAEEALKRVEGHVTCHICFEIYTDPKVLNCFHAYCQKCLVPLVKDQQGKYSITCPACRQVTPIQENVAGLPAAFYISNYLDIREPLINSEDRNTASAALAEPNPVKNVRYCFTHRLKILDLYCETCEKLICHQCTGKHPNHRYHGLSEAFEEYKKYISSSLGPIEKQVTVVKYTRLQLEVCCEEITDQQVAINSNIEVTFNQLQKILDTRKTKLISQLDKITEVKLKSLATQMEELEFKQACLESCQLFMKESQNTSGNEDDVLMMKENTVEQVRELITPLHLDILEPNVKADTVFSATADATAVCQNYGQVCRCTPGSVDPTLLARVDSLHILNESVVEQRGVPILSIGGLKRPRGVAVNKRGEVIVTEVDCCNVSVFGPSGERIRNFGMHGTDCGQVSRLRGVAVDSEGNILVADSGNHRIQGFTAEGAFIGAVGTRGSGELEFSFPTGIAVANRNNIYVADWTNQRVQVLNSDFTFSSTFGSKGRGAGQFDRPWGIAFDSTGEVYVADSFNHRIQVFTAEGEFLRMFGKLGNGLGELCEPVGIAIDANDMVYVSEGYNNRISVFTAKGRFLTSFGTKGKGPGEFQHPNGLAVDDKGVLYVCDAHNGRVELFNTAHIVKH